MTGSRIVAGGASVVGTETNAVGPAVKDKCAAGGSGNANGERRSGGHGGDSGWNVAAGIGLVETSGCASGLNAALVFFSEVVMESSHGLRRYRLVFPFVNGQSKDAAVFEDREDKSDGSLITDRLGSGNGKSLTITNPAPETFEGVFGHPNGSETLAVGIEVGRFDGAIGGE